MSLTTQEIAKARSTHTNEFVEEDVSERCTGGSVQREATRNPLGREVDFIEGALSLQDQGESLDLVMILDVNNETRNEGAQDLSNNVSDCFQGRETLEDGGRNSNTRTEMSSRHRSTDGNGKDDSYGIGETNTE